MAKGHQVPKGHRVQAYLEQPVAASVECRQDGRMNVASINTFNALDFQFHVVLSSCFSIFPLFPAVSVLPIPYLLTAVEQHSAWWWPANRYHIGKHQKQWFTNRCPIKQHKIKHFFIIMRQMRTLGYVPHLSDQIHPKIVLKWTPIGGKRKQERQENTWRCTIHRDQFTAGVSWDHIEEIAANRDEWKVIVAQRTC